MNIEKSPPKFQVLSIEDDPAIRRLLRTTMMETPFRLRLAPSAAQALELIAKKPPELILVDLHLPDGSGLELIKKIRQWSAIPIIALSADGEPRSKVDCLLAGANDYVTKPFGLKELVARMRAALRRANVPAAASLWPIFQAGPLYVDLINRTVQVNGEEVFLTHLEFKLFATLIKYSGQVVGHEQLLEEVWGQEYAKEAQYLRVYIGYLRRKLEVAGMPQLIVNEPRIGYRLSEQLLTMDSSSKDGILQWQTSEGSH